MSGTHITEEEAEVVANFASEVAYHMHLPRYSFLVMEEPCEEDALASIELIEDRWIAQVRLSTEWMKRGESERMNTVIHEVCHVLHRELDWVMSQARNYMHDYEHNMLADQYRHQAELMVDHMALFLSEMKPIKKAWVKLRKKTAAKYNAK